MNADMTLLVSKTQEKGPGEEFQIARYLRTSITEFHDEIDMAGCLLAVPQGDDILVMQLCNFLEDLYLFTQQILRFGQILLLNQLHGHHLIRSLKRARKQGHLNEINPWIERIID